MYNKRIVCDIDDTISFCDNRDWKNAKPNPPVIQKLKSMYDHGILQSLGQCNKPVLLKRGFATTLQEFVK